MAESGFDRAIDIVLEYVEKADDFVDDVQDIIAAVDVTQLSDEDKERVARLTEQLARADELGDRAIAALERAKTLDDRAVGLINRVKEFFAKRKAERAARRAARQAQ